MRYIYGVIREDNIIININKSNYTSLFYNLYFERRRLLILLKKIILRPITNKCLISILSIKIF